MQEQSHITQLLEQNKLLMEMVYAMQNELKELREIVDNVDVNTNTIKRTFTKAKPKQQQITKAEKIAKLSASILKRGKKIA